MTPIPNISGAYPNLKNQPFYECIALTEEQAKTFFAYNGFVEIEAEHGDEGMVATSVTPNTEAWEAWRAEVAANPEPETEPTELEQLRADIDYISIMTGWYYDCL